MVALDSQPTNLVAAAQTYLCDVCNCRSEGKATELALRLGINRGKSFVGFVAIKQCWLSWLPLLVLGLGLLGCVEMFRVFLPRFADAQSHERKHPFAFLVWFAAAIYGIYRNSRWLFMYFNELWFVILVTQVFLTATDGFCFVALWTGAVRPASAERAGLDAGSKHKANQRVQQVVTVFKLWHLIFFVIEVAHAAPTHGVLDTLFGDKVRNVTFLAEDLLYLHLFFAREELLAILKSKRMWAAAAAFHLIYLGVVSLSDGSTTT
jgi:hypothetical protein